MKIVAILLAVGTALTAPAMARSQTASPPDAGASAERTLLAQRYLKAVHMDRTIQSLLNSMVPAMLAQQLKDKPNLTDSERANLGAVVSEATSYAFATVQSDYDRSVVEIISSIYSKDELIAMDDFYESPMGQSIVDKQQQMAGPVTKAMIGLLPRIEEVMKQRLCDKLGCGVAPTGAKSGPA